MSLRITSRHNPRLKQAAQLRDSRHRRATGRLLIDGARETLRALVAGVTPIEAFVDESIPHERAAEALAELQRLGVPTYPVASDAFAKLAYGDRADGVVLVAEGQARGLADLTLPAAPLVAILAGVEKPGNLGAILRTADGAGVDAVVVADPRVDLFNPNAIRASVGAVFRQNIAVATADETRQWLQERGVTLYATRPEAAMAYTAANFVSGCAIVLGSEAEGLDPAWDAAATGIALPMRGVADSLNVSAAAAVLLYEARRQRGAKATSSSTQRSH
ncbi:23S rRNA (guanosine-2'-O-)-methyltransferase RlmB [Botrimarina colliarenosi]|uniref:23S rRNA (Guanosine-2'-O-)-methyltransferase RlmB n=1 Tax=Botrimarina colliarenosi TaxID=2528001 RepID=A0A5C6A9I4_9BACT|nr:TrmH family RNA methyltransferase [Botrimarina colliarenosi]TWT96209.1 23S rRNA (guanosine-2'-O-)-methyltransferase RlmB [Botrimarina colliarenosi]